MLNKTIVILLSSVLILSGCAGKTANPIMTHRPGDHNASCVSLNSEMNEIQGEIQRRVPKTNKTGKNVGLGVAGAFLLVPWFFMDFSDAEKVEINAYRTRHNHLVRISNEKGCSGERSEIASFTKKPKKRK